MTSLEKKLTDEELDHILSAVDQYSRFNQVVKVKRLSEGARLPTQGSEEDFAFDLYLSEDVIIPPSLLSASMAKTDIATEFDEDRWGLFISPRSSIFRLPLILTNSTGIIEGTYRGGLGIPLRNTLSWFHYTDANEYDRINTSSTAITIEEDPDGNKYYKQVRAEDLPAKAVQEAKDKYMKELLTLGVSYPEPHGMENFGTYLPSGTVFLPEGFRITQCYLVPKVHVLMQDVNELSDSERGTKGFGSSGMGV